MNKITLPVLKGMKEKHDKISVVTCYDASFARLVEKAEIESVLVGDSLGMVIKGEENTLNVSIEEMEYHVRAVKRAVKNAFIIADMPFGSYQASMESGVRNAVKLLKAGAEAVKLEGGEEIAGLVKTLTRSGIPVCGHVGLTPQFVNKFGGFLKQGKNDEEREFIFKSAKCIEEAGADLIVLESIPHILAAEITRALKIPTIGIGAGNDTDGQVLVIYDLLGMNQDFNPSFLKKYCDLDKVVSSALSAYKKDVKS